MEHPLSTAPVQRGRAKDPGIDERLLAVANRHLSARGFDSMSLAAIAHEAGTTRQALYRRWPTKAILAAAAIRVSAELPSLPPSLGPFADLVAELTDFQRGVSRPGRLSLVGTMLQDGTDADLRAHYQAHIVAPRRARIGTILQRAQHLELIDPDADLDIAITMCTGSWYARALAGKPPPPHWPNRIATLVWRAVGGAPLPTATIDEQNAAGK